MGIRETLEKKQSLSIGVAILVIVGAGVAIVLQARDFGSGNAGDAYFTTDDGQTFFVDDGRKIPPFDEGGKPAVKAHVFECGGKRVVGYLSRYTPEAIAAMQEAKKYKGTGKPPPNVKALASIGTTGLEVKKPGPGNPWVRQSDSARATKIRVFRCPDGSTPNEVGPD